MPVAIFGAVGVLGILAMFFIPMEREITGLTVLVVTLSMALAGVPIAISMIGASIIGMWKLGGWTVVEATLSEGVFTSVASWQLSVIPMFILMGIVMAKSGMSLRAYEAARQWFGRVPGGLAIGTNFAGAGLAASSGSSIGISYTLGRVAIPEMLRANYKPSLATGVVTMAGVLGQLIPPSIMLVIYAGIAQVSVGPQLMAAFVPAIGLAFAFGVYILLAAVIRPSLAPRADLTGVTWATRFRSLIGVIPIALVILILLGGMYSGVFTATEAGAFGAIAAIAGAWLLSGRENRRASVIARNVRESAWETASSVAAIMMLIIAVALLTRVMTLSRVAVGLTDLVVSLELSRVEFLFALLVFYLILGAFMDPLSMMILTVPLLSAPLAELDVNMIWFGVFLVILAELGAVSPPIGLLVFIVHRLTQDPTVNLGTPIKLTDVFKGVAGFCGIALVLLLILIFYPELVMWLPDQMVR